MAWKAFRSKPGALAQMSATRQVAALQRRVAARAVVGAETEGRNLRLKLTDGLVTPVEARPSVAAVREAGWLDGA